MITRVASCSCGALEVTCTGDPTLVSACHCSACKKRTGSALGIAAFFPREKVEIRGTPSKFTRMGESGLEVVFYFCPACGSSVFWEPKRKPESIAVALGAFDDPDFPPPGKEAHPEGRYPWVRISI